MKTICRHLVYAVLTLALLVSPAMGWVLEASFASWEGDYPYGYGYYPYDYGYYPYDYGYDYYPYYSTVYAQPAYPDIVYPVIQEQTTNVIYVEQPQPHYDNTNVVYQPPADYSQATNYCGDDWCSSTETQQSCPADCTPAPYCGDRVCNSGEIVASCPYDCKTETTSTSTRNTAYCGDGRCNNAETKYSCPQDCGIPAYCGDGACNGAETRQNCAQDCGLAPYCGDGRCDKDETRYNCAVDCGLPGYCGDGTCGNTETKYSCPLDCGAPKCADPTGDAADEICKNREILICDDGLWDFKKSVQCCVSTDCADGYKCDYNRCVLKPQVVVYACSEPAAPVYRCGDGFCNGAETCGTCQADCGPCQRCGDGVCSLQTEDQYNCPLDCGEPASHSIELNSTDECFEIEQGKSQEFTIKLKNRGNAIETLVLSAAGNAAAWTAQQPSVTVRSGAKAEWLVTVSVPQDAEPGLYNITVLAENSKTRGSTVLHVDVKLPPMENATVVPVQTGGNMTGGTPTGAFVASGLAIPDWALVLGILFVIGLFLILLLAKASRAARPVVIATDGGQLPAWATKAR